MREDKNIICAHKSIILMLIYSFNNYCHWYNPQTDPKPKMTWPHEHRACQLRPENLWPLLQVSPDGQ